MTHEVKIVKCSDGNEFQIKSFDDNQKTSVSIVFQLQEHVMPWREEKKEKGSIPEKQKNRKKRECLANSKPQFTLFTGGC